MNIYKEEYKRKLCSLRDAYDLINDGDYIATGFAGSEPMGFFHSLHTISDRINSVRITNSLEMGTYECFTNEKYRGTFFSDSYFLMSPGRAAVKNKRKEFIPSHLHSGATRQVESQKIDIFVCSVTPMDDLGYFRTSLSSICEDQYAKASSKVILEVVPDLPVIYGDNEIHISDVDAVYECKRRFPMVDSPETTDDDKKIGEYVATLVESGATIQLGIGAIPDAVAQAFTGKKDLGIHTEMITNSVVDLVESGAVTGKCKTLHRGKIIGTFTLGNKRLYDFLEKNPAVAIMPGWYVNDPYIIAQNDNMVSINTAISVDFTGQVASESLGYRQYSGTGGQSDTAIGAIHAKNGKSIIALKSTVKNGEISTICPMLPLGSVVTLSRNNVDYIVTEYGIAKMKNRTLNERAQSLIKIAHPKFREELSKKAKELGYI